MKKILLSAFVLSLTSVSINGQSLITQNFNSMPVGNISTVFDGSLAGANGLFLLSQNGAAPTTTNNASLSTGQILDQAGNKVLSIAGPNGDKGGTFIWENGLATAFTNRTSGNNIVEIEVDINPGTRNVTSSNRFGLILYNAGFTRQLVGFNVSRATGELFLVAYSTPSGSPVDNYNYSLAAAPGIQLPENTVSRVGVAYNFTTGQVRIKAPGIAPAGLTLAGSSAATAPAEVDFTATAGGTAALPNTASTSVTFDNLIIRASATDTLLGLSNNVVSNKFSVSPNPTSDFVNISSSDNIGVNGVSVTDLNGRTVKELSYNNLSSIEVNLSDLSAGMYLMTIKSEQGIATKKIMKK